MKFSKSNAAGTMLSRMAQKEKQLNDADTLQKIGQLVDLLPLLPLKSHPLVAGVQTSS